MDFVQGIGERYLIGKANAAPQQLENLAKKQFLKGDDPATPKAPPAVLDAGKDKEIEKLRKELAVAKLSQKKHGKQREASADSKMANESDRKPPSVVENFSGKSPVSRRVPQTHSKPTERSHKHKIADEAHEPRGRSDSIKTANAARRHSADPVKFREVNYSSSSSPHAHRQAQASEARQRVLQAMSTQAVASNQTSRGERTYQPIATTVSQRPRQTTDLCVVEVLEEEPLRRRRTHQSRANVVEVIERDKNRTRYVVR
ncbi:MAG: hypothetical protein LQ346_002301 [Caloplaca aetnensis]|nr:MAG: hypothetical protein LQ346_002301 [Caloplaca aetnensis]